MGSQIFPDAPLAHAPPILVLNVVFFGKLVQNPSCITNLKLLASTVAEINKGSQIFWMLPYPGPLPIYIASCFSASYSPSPSFVPNLKLLASTVAEINRGSEIFTCSPSTDPH